MTHSLKHYGIVKYHPSMTHWSAEEAYAWDENQVRAGIAIETLMDRAGKQIARVLSNHYDKAAPFVVFAGKGNNGGDGIVASRYLVSLGYKVRLICLYPIEECSTLVQTQLELWHGMGYQSELCSDALEISDEGVVIDAILGIGMKGALRQKERSCLDLIHQTESTIWSIDVPSGSGTKNVIKASYLISIQAPKVVCKDTVSLSHYVVSIL